MRNIDAHIDLVKSQLEFHKRQAVRFVDEPRRVTLHETTALRFQALLDELTALKEWAEAHPDWQEKTEADEIPPKRLTLSWEEIEGLPPEVLQELSISDADKTEFNIISAIRAMGGVVSLDRLIVYLWKNTKELHKRTQLNQKLYRMTQKEAIYSVPGKKGVYSTEPMTEEQATELK